MENVTIYSSRIIVLKCNLSPLRVTVHAALFHLCLNCDNLIKNHSAHHNVRTDVRVCFHKERFTPPVDPA